MQKWCIKSVSTGCYLVEWQRGLAPVIRLSSSHWTSYQAHHLGCC
jgi:hypothetical protein